MLLPKPMLTYHEWGLTWNALHSYLQWKFEIHKFRITATSPQGQWVNTLRPRQDGCHFPDDTFKLIFVNENIWISITISLKFVPRASINNISALVQILAWHQPGNKPSSEPMMVSLLLHIRITQPQWVEENNKVNNKFKYSIWDIPPSYDISDNLHWIIW